MKGAGNSKGAFIGVTDLNPKPGRGQRGVNPLVYSCKSITTMQQDLQGKQTWLMNRVKIINARATAPASPVCRNNTGGNPFNG